MRYIHAKSEAKIFWKKEKKENKNINSFNIINPFESGQSYMLLRRMNGVFAVYKPSGITSAKFIDKIQDKFTKSGVFAKDLHDMKEKIRKDLGTNKNGIKRELIKGIIS